MKNLPRAMAVLIALTLLTGCMTTSALFSMTRDFAVGIYTATAQQIRTADERAAAAFRRFSPERKAGLEATDTRYLAVRTLDPTAEQMNAIRSDMAKPSSRYGAPTRKTPKVYCVMIWDTMTREIVGTKCFATLSLPKDGEVARFDTFTAQYVEP